MKDRVAQAAVELGLPMSDRQKTYNSRLAQELGKWAESQDKGDAFHAAAFKTYFVEGKNIAKIPVLVDTASSVGLSPDEAESVLKSRAYKAAVDEDWSLSHKNGITAIPTFVLNTDKLVGAQPYEMLERLMKVNGIKKRKG